MDKQLNFISDEELEKFTRHVLDKVSRAKAKKSKNLYKNVVDPFSAVFDSAIQKIDLTEWLNQESIRQVQKTLQNFVGEFHQNVIGSVTGWEDLKVGSSIDLRNRDKKIIAEIKNKYNTMNSSSALSTYDKLQKHLDFDESYKGFTAYCVFIVPKNHRPLDTTFHPSEKGTSRQTRENIRSIDGRSFYKLVTDDPKAIDKLYLRLGVILSKILQINTNPIYKDVLFFELFQKAYIDKV